MPLSRRRVLTAAAPAAVLPFLASPGVAGASSTGSLTLLTPFRLQDSRTMEPDKYDTSARDSLADPRLAGHLGALMNITVTGTEGSGFFRLGAGFVDPPATSNVNWWGAGQTLANLALVELSSAGGFVIQGGGSGRAHVIIDVVALVG